MWSRGKHQALVPAEPGFESQSFTSCLCDLWQVLKPQLLYLSNRVTLIVRICYPQSVLHKMGYAISLCLNAIQLWGVNKWWGKWRTTGEKRQYFLARTWQFHLVKPHLAPDYSPLFGNPTLFTWSKLQGKLSQEIAVIAEFFRLLDY